MATLSASAIQNSLMTSGSSESDAGDTSAEISSGFTTIVDKETKKTMAVANIQRFTGPQERGATVRNLTKEFFGGIEKNFDVVAVGGQLYQLAQEEAANISDCQEVLNSLVPESTVDFSSLVQSDKEEEESNISLAARTRGTKRKNKKSAQANSKKNQNAGGAKRKKATERLPFSSDTINQIKEAVNVTSCVLDSPQPHSMPMEIENTPINNSCPRDENSPINNSSTEYGEIIPGTGLQSKEVASINTAMKRKAQRLGYFSFSLGKRGSPQKLEPRQLTYETNKDGLQVPKGLLTKKGKYRPCVALHGLRAGIKEYFSLKHKDVRAFIAEHSFFGQRGAKALDPVDRKAIAEISKHCELWSREYGIPIFDWQLTPTVAFNDVKRNFKR